MSFGDQYLTKKHLCFVGNMLGRNPDYVTTQGQIVSDCLEKEGFTITSTSSKTGRIARFVDIILTLIRGATRFELVVLEVYSGMYFVVATAVSITCKILGIPLVQVLHGGNLPEFAKRFPRWTSRIFKMADEIVAPSTYLSRVISTGNGSIRVIPNVIELSDYPFRERSKIKPKLIWMRSFHPVYNPQMAIEVLASLCETEPEAELTMAGNNKGIEEEVRELAVAKGVSEAVRFVGFLDHDQKVEEFGKSDIYINTNRIDNMPVSVLEARCMGLPVVATDVGGLPDLIAHGTDGMIGASEDVDQMVRNIKELVDDPELTLRISKNGRGIAERSAWASTFGLWKDLFRDVLPQAQETAGLNAGESR